MAGCAQLNGLKRADCRAEWKSSVFTAQVQFKGVILRPALCEHEKTASPVAAYRDGTFRTFSSRHLPWRFGQI